MVRLFKKYKSMIVSIRCIIINTSYFRRILYSISIIGFASARPKALITENN